MKEASHCGDRRCLTIQRSASLCDLCTKVHAERCRVTNHFAHPTQRFRIVTFLPLPLQAACGKTRHPYSHEDQVASSNQTAHQLATAVCNALFERLATSGKVRKADLLVDIRSFLELLLEDLVACYQEPVLPAAGLLLGSFV